MDAPGVSTLRVVNCWLMPPLATVRVARISLSLASSTTDAEHQGRNCG